MIINNNKRVVSFNDKIQFINSQVESIKSNERLYEHIYKELLPLVKLDFESEDWFSYPSVFSYGKKVLAIVGKSHQERSVVIDIIRNTWEFITGEIIEVISEATLDEAQKNLYESQKPDKMFIINYHYEDTPES